MAYLELSLDVVGERNLLRNIEQMPAQVRDILLTKLEPVVAGLASQVQANIASRLNKKSGRLESSVEYEVKPGDGNHIIARVFLDSTVAPYARAQEEGAIIPPHMIYPKQAAVLSWVGASGDRQAALRVSHPGAVLAPHWFLRDAMRQYGPRLTTAIKRSVVEGIRARMRSGS